MLLSVGVIMTLGLVPGSLFAQSLNVLSASNTPNEIQGIEILHGSRGSKPFVSYFDIMDKLSFVQNQSLAESLKSGNVSSIVYTQEDVDLIAQTTPDGQFSFYSNYPLNQLGQIPAIVTDLSKEFKPEASTFFKTVSDPLKKVLRRGNHQPSSSSSSHLQTRSAVYKYAESIPVNPLVDPFYHQPLNLYASLKSGTPFAYRYVGLNFLFYPPLTRSAQVVYKTDGTQGQPQADITTILIPALNDGSTIVSYQVHEDSVNLYCSYSYWYTLGYIDVATLAFLEKRWIVSLPDYEGPDSTFGAYYRAGLSVLNSVRAAVQMGPQLKYTSNNAFLYGYSSGATATGIAAELAKSYAPDLLNTIKGVALGGYVVNLNHTIYSVNKGHYAGLILMVMHSLYIEYPDVKKALYDDLTDEGKFYLDIAGQGCSQTLYLFYGMDVFKVMKNPPAFLQSPALLHALEQCSAGQSAPPFDIYVQQSSKDDVAPVEIVDSTVNLYCKGGSRVRYTRGDWGGHASFEAIAPYYVPEFIQSIIDGKSLAKPCNSWQDVIFNPPPP